MEVIGGVAFEVIYQRKRPFVRVLRSRGSVPADGPTVATRAGSEPNGAARLRAAVAAAIAAYAASGRMLDAALAYAAGGLPVFPLTKHKRPVPARNRDADGKPIAGTGGFKKASTNPAQIHVWWDHSEFLIGLPTGERSGVWGLDIDTPEEHADGVTAWQQLAAQHEPIITREHRSATGGPHLIFSWDANRPVGCSSRGLPEGVEAKGEGGYIAVPPSRRGGRAYSVHRDVDPIDAPTWLTDLVAPQQRARPAKASDGSGGQARYAGQTTAGDDEIKAALAWIPNDNVHWDEWKAMGLRIYAATRGRGFDLFESWSQKSSKHNPSGTVQAWQEIENSPPTATGAGAIFKLARQGGYLPECTPSYPGSAGDAATARREIRTRVEAFRARAEAYDGQGEPPVEALRVDTGIGKSEAVIDSYAERSDPSGHPPLFTTDRHRLNEKIEERFGDVGVVAKVFRGRTAPDPDNPGQAMCLNPRQVALAVKLYADVSATCCKNGRGAAAKRCRLFACGYQGQQQGEAPAVWIAAHDVLFHPQPVFGTPAAVIIDEAIWQKGIRGIEDDWTVPIDSLIRGAARPDLRDEYRRELGEALDRQLANGGVERENLAVTLTATMCESAIAVEWNWLPTLGLTPGMTDSEVATLENNSDTIDAIQHARRLIKIWEEVLALLRGPDIEVSGRLTLKQRGGQRVVEWRGVTAINKQFRVPTLLLDATLPELELLQVYYPQVEVARLPPTVMPGHTRIRQVLGTPTSAGKIDKYLDDVQRHILQRWIETGRAPTLVICQQKVEQQLKLPANIRVAHYNDITGLDEFKTVRLLVLVGRTAPGPKAMEALAAALSGRQPVAVEGGTKGFRWYRRIKRGIRLPDGRGIATMGDEHPDPFVEAVRWQVHEGELMQALGRPRGVNRTAATPLDIELLFDTCLPITVDEVVNWRAPSRLVQTAAIDGVMLTAPVNLVTLWPELWPNRTAADRTVAQGVPALPGFERVEYQLAGNGMKQRIAFFDRSIVPDPRTWLESRLGALT